MEARDAAPTAAQADWMRLGFVQEGILKNEDIQEPGSLRDTVVTARYDDATLPVTPRRRWSDPLAPLVNR